MNTTAAAGELIMQVRARQFASVRAALLWYRDQLAARLRMSQEPGAVRVRPSEEERERGAVTFAAVARCLKPVHAGDPQGLDADELSELRYRVSGEAQCLLISWYEDSDWQDGNELARSAGLFDHDPDGPCSLRELARRAGVHRRTLERRCKRTERALRARLEREGLLCCESAGPRAEAA